MNNTPHRVDKFCVRDLFMSFHLWTNIIGVEAISTFNSCSVSVNIKTVSFHNI